MLEKSCPKLNQNSVKISKVTKDTKVSKTIENHRILLDNICTCCFSLVVERSHGKVLLCHNKNL